MPTINKCIPVDPQVIISHDSVQISAVSTTTYRIVWSEVTDSCLLYNGELIGYTVDISNSSTSFTINTTSTEVLTSDLVADIQYNITVAVVNVVGVGPYSDAVVFEAGTCKSITYLFYINILYSTRTSKLYINTINATYISNYIMEYTRLCTC